MMEALLLSLEIVHLVLGFFLIYIALRAYKRTGYRSMVLLAVGFALMVIGDTVIEDLLYRTYDNYALTRTTSEIFEILGFLVLLFAVKKSNHE